MINDARTTENKIKNKKILFDLFFLMILRLEDRSSDDVTKKLFFLVKLCLQRFLHFFFILNNRIYCHIQ